MFIWTFLLRITHTIISRSLADSSWITLYMELLVMLAYGRWDLIQRLTNTSVTINLYVDVMVIVACLYFAIYVDILKGICFIHITRIFKIWRWIGPHVVWDVRQGQCLKSLHKALLSLRLTWYSLILVLRPSSSLSFLFLAELQTVCKQYWNKIYILEGDKWELERISKLKEFEVKKRAILCECFIPVIALTSLFLLFICPHLLCVPNILNCNAWSSRWHSSVFFTASLFIHKSCFSLLYTSDMSFFLYCN